MIAANGHHDAFGKVAGETDSTTTLVKPPGCGSGPAALPGYYCDDTGLAGPADADRGAGLKAHGPEHGSIVGVELLFDDYAALAGPQLAKGDRPPAGACGRPGSRGGAGWAG